MPVKQNRKVLVLLFEDINDLDYCGSYRLRPSISATELI